MPSLAIFSCFGQPRNSVVAGSMDGRRLDGIFVAAAAAVVVVTDVCFASNLNFNSMD